MSIDAELSQFRMAYSSRLKEFRELILSNLVMTAQIPAIAFDESDRAEFVFQRFNDAELLDNDIAGAGNVSATWKRKNGRRRLLLLAHLDTHFGRSSDHNIAVTQHQVVGPGVAYNSLGVATLITLPDILGRLHFNLENTDIIFLATTKAQGRGDMEGIRSFLQTSRERVDLAVNLMGITLGRLDYFSLSRIRCDITCQIDEGDNTPTMFGERNAILVMNELINQLTAIPLPNNPRTLINYGKFEGGESYAAPSDSARLSLEIRSESDEMRADLEERIHHHCMFVGSKFGTEIRADFFGRQAATQLRFAHPLVQSAYNVLHQLDLQPYMAPSNTEITVLLANQIPAITLGISKGHNPLTKEASIEIDHIATGLLQILMLIYSIDKGYCDDESR
jgi:acetylornithine deacetylase/succinyl-diaminopimelate desuccinylase-like protein